MVIYDKGSRTSEAINGREAAPRRMTHDLYLNLTANHGEYNNFPKLTSGYVNSPDRTGSGIITGSDPSFTGFFSAWL